MKKLFLLISVLALSLMAGAKTINITPTSPHSSGNNLLATLSDESTVDGDVIILADGTYSEYSNYIYFDKSVEVKAADGAHPVVEVECEVRIGKNASNKNVTIRGIKFDGSKQDGTGSNATSYSHFFRIYSAGTLDFENCEFYSSANKVMEVESTSSVASLVVNNCYFHDNTKNCISIENTVASDLTVTNSTFANCSTTSKGTIFSKAAASSVIRVDHCTFYDCTTESTDYGVIGHNGFLPTDVVVSNCIFAWSTTYDKRATYLPSGTSVTNCLTYNTSKDTGTWGHHSGPTFTSCSLQDPLFDDLENDKYTYAGDWTTMDLSPARGAATDGSDLGDPRWYSNEVLPSVNFASDYNLVGAKALLTGNIELNESSHIKYTGSSTPGVATWKMHITKKCVINAVADREAESTSGCELTLTVYNAEGDEVSTISAAASHNDNDINFNGSLFIPGEGDYTFKLTNATSWSGAILEKIILSYVGGDVQNMPGTTAIADAWFSSGGTRADSKIDFPDGYIQDGWVKWNVAFASAGNYNVTVNIDNVNDHNYTVALYRSESDESPITIGEGSQKSTIGTIELGAMEVPAGNYIMKVTNATQYSDAKLVSVTFAYAGGGVVEFGKASAGSLLANADAIVSDDWSIEGGKITHAESKALTGWAKWNVDCQDYGNYNVTVNISSDNGHLVRVEIFENEAESAIYTLDETSSTQYHTGDQAIDLGNIVLDDREYVVKVSNTGAYSHVQIASIVITYQNGAKQSIPGSLTLTDAILSEKAYIESSMLYFAPHDCGTIPDEWAKWNLSVAGAGVYQFTVNVTSPNGQKYQILIEDNGGNEVYNLVQTSSLGTGDKSFTTGMIYMESGNYTLEMRNVYPYSDGHLVSISAAAVANVLTIDENATDNTVIHNNYRNGTHTIHLIRTITPNMYNTICLPFDVNSSQLQAIFGSDVELLQMASASLGGDVLDLNFDVATSIYRGTPYLIRTTKTVSNPVFTDVEIKEETGQATSDDGADFIGSFVKTTIDADEYNLFLGSGDKLYFSNNAVTLKGLRAYFHIKDNGSGAPIRKARIVEQNKIVTELELIDGEWQDIKSANGIIKTIENGQLILIRDGKRYNVMGIRF